MFFRIKAYLKFLWFSKNEHAVHSPFVFNLLTKCLYDTSPKPEYLILEKHLKSAPRNPKKTVAINSKRAKLLFRITHYLQPKSILEINSSSEIAAIAFSLGSPNATIGKLESCLTTGNLVATDLEKYDLIYFSNTPSKEATLSSFKQLLPTISNDTVWLFNDIHSSANIEEAWETMKLHPKVSVTIDAFRWGFVFFRKEQPKEHFVIRV